MSAREAGAPQPHNLSARFDRERGAWGIQVAAPGTPPGKWLSQKRWKSFAEAYAEKERR